MRTIIEYMQLCHIQFYQKIARKNVDRVLHLHDRHFCVRFFDKSGCGKVAYIQ